MCNLQFLMYLYIFYIYKKLFHKTHKKPKNKTK